jgi:hypothetical protein
MGAFEYTALDPSGRERKGTLEGDTARQVRQMLREQSLLPVTVAEVAQHEAKRRAARWSSFSTAARHVGRGLVARHTTVGDTGPLGSAARRSIARGVRADREAAHQKASCWACARR